MVLSFLIFGLGFFIILFFNVHYVFLLLGLEMVLLGVLLSLGMGLTGGLSLLSLLFFLLVMVCLGGFSISLLVSMSREYGQDFWFHSYLF